MIARVAPLFLLIFLSMFAVRAHAADKPPPVPWEITGTSSIADVPESRAGYRIERRVFEKKSHVLVRTGFSYLSRGDFYTSPGIGLDATYYPAEIIGLDLFSGTVFFSQLTDSAQELRRTTGLLPDSQKPIVRLSGGARIAFAYGKLFVEALDTVVHIDANVALHLGALVTDKGPNFGGDVGLSLQAVGYGRFILWLEGSWFVSYEKRTSSSIASGPLTTIGVGVLF
jgi:hypothetical protein